MEVRSVRILGIAAGAILAVPLVLIVVVPLLVTFLGWLVGVPGAFLAEILPERDATTVRGQ